MASTNKYVPEELRYQIFLRLPVKSLLRFKCVCKSWNKIISSKSFRDSHLIHKKSTSNSKRYLLFDHEDFYSANLINNESCLDVETSDHIGCYTPKFSETGSEQYGSCFLEVYGICDGLLCLSDGQLRLRSTIYLWNPIARRGKKIPNPYETYSYCAEPYGLAFGYYDDDYKVIKITRFMERYDVYIYSLSTDEWKFVRLIDPDYMHRGVDYDNYMQYPNAMLVNGVAYFLKKEPCQVVCFDINSEVIRAVNFPEHFKADSSFTMKAYGESIVLLEYYCSGISGDMVMWILSSKLTWEMSFSVDFKKSYPLGFIDDGNVIVRTSDSYKFMLFNLETNQFTELEFRQLFKTLIDWETVWGIKSFVESFVLLDENTMDDEYIVKERCSCSANTAAFTLQKWRI